MLFWTLAIAFAAGLSLILALAARSGAGMGGGAEDLAVYRDQMAELERDLGRGVIAPGEAEQARTEIARRILAADRALGAMAPTATAPKSATWALVGAMVVLVGIGGPLGYAWLGAPGYPDLGIAERRRVAEAARAERLPQAQAEARVLALRAPPPAPSPEFAALIAQLREAVAARPDDLQGLALLARNEAALGNFGAAVVAQRHIIAVIGEAARAEDFSALADLMVLATGGYVSPEAEAAADAALARDPRNGAARYFKGLADAQTGRYDRAFATWAELLAEGPEDAGWIAPIEAQIGTLAAMAGVAYTPPAPTTGPSAADVAAAGEMTEAERQEMIRTMVEGLAERLASAGGPAADWARLIGALAVLGQTDRARAIWAEAQTVFADQPADIAALAEAAARAGITR